MIVTSMQAGKQHGEAVTASQALKEYRARAYKEKVKHSIASITHDIAASSGGASADRQAGCSCGG